MEADMANLSNLRTTRQCPNCGETLPADIRNCSNCHGRGYDDVVGSRTDDQDPRDDGTTRAARKNWH
jgi:hypothetical protein